MKWVELCFIDWILSGMKMKSQRKKRMSTFEFFFFLVLCFNFSLLTGKCFGINSPEGFSQNRYY